MDITLNIIEGKPANRWVAIAQKISLFGPIFLIAAAEMVVKNLICLNVINGGIGILNALQGAFASSEPPSVDPPAVEVPEVEAPVRPVQREAPPAGERDQTNRYARIGLGIEAAGVGATWVFYATAGIWPLVAATVVAAPYFFPKVSEWLR